MPVGVRLTRHFYSVDKSLMIYVDKAKIKYRNMLMSHMIADSLEELHKMANLLGIRREHFQDKRISHYDICEVKRLQAIRLGAKEVSSKQLVMISKGKN
jgi:hypothetical protein